MTLWIGCWTRALARLGLGRLSAAAAQEWDGQGSADAEQTAGEGLTAQGKFSGQEGDEAEHGHAAI